MFIDRHVFFDILEAMQIIKLWRLCLSMLVSFPVTWIPDDADRDEIQRIGKGSPHDPIMWKSFIPMSCHSRKTLPSWTRWERRMRRSHTFMQRKNLFSSLPTSQTIGSQSSRHNYGTDL